MPGVTAELAAARLDCRTDQVLVASTGIIGHQLPMDRIEAGIDRAIGGLGSGPESFQAAAGAIMTTDTRPKLVSIEADASAPGRDGAGAGERGRDDRAPDGDDARLSADGRSDLGQRLE